MEKILEEIGCLDLFSNEERENLIAKIRKNDKGKNIIECLVRKTDIILTPEEAVRQLFLNRLINEGVKVDKFEIKKPTLNDIFIERVGGQ